MTAVLSDDTFLIEIRLARTKWRIKRVTERITTLFSLQEFAERHPHVTLFGPCTLLKEVTIPCLKRAIEDAAAPYSAVPFLIDGYDMNQGLNGAVLAYRIVPSDLLVSLNRAVSSAIRPLSATVNIWDTDPERKWFHVTIANRLDRKKGVRIFERLTGQMAENITTIADGGCPAPGTNDAKSGAGVERSSAVPRHPVLDEDGIRISIIHGNEILAEYDLARHRWFRPTAPSAAAEWQRSLRRLRKDRGIELVRQCKPVTGRTFVISDLHLGHANIIRYCSRPFPHDAVDEMDRVLIRNWNCTVRRRDRVFYLGDISCKSGRPSGDYLRLLNGSITRIAGNHDHDAGRLPLQETIVFEGIPFTLVHDPDDAARVPGGWVIHGHHHNNDLSRYPFINFRERRINVSAEVVGYRPMAFAELAGILRNHASAPARDCILLRDA